MCKILNTVEVTIKEKIKWLQRYKQREIKTKTNDPKFKFKDDIWGCIYEIVKKYECETQEDLIVLMVYEAIKERNNIDNNEELIKYIASAEYFLKERYIGSHNDFKDLGKI